MRAVVARSVAAVVALVAATTASMGAQSATRMTAFVDVRVFSSDFKSLREHQTVLVTGDQISAIGPKTRIVIPRGAERVEGKGVRILLPGLVDTHVHLEGGSWMLAPLLDAGVTTVFNLRGDESHLRMRDSVRDGTLKGPRIFTSGGYLNVPMIQSAADADSAVDAQFRAGFDLLKIHGNVAPAAYDQLSAASVRVHMPLVGHAPRNLPFDSVLTHHQVLVVHAEELLYTHFQRDRSDVRIADVAKRMAAAGIWLTPTLSTYHAIARQIGKPIVVDSALASDAGLTLPAAMRDFWRGGLYTGRELATAPQYEDNFRFQQKLVRALHRAGVRLLAGTDIPLPLMFPGGALHDELAELVAIGLTPREVLLIATRNAGDFVQRYLRSQSRVGVIEAGAWADLILVDRDPSLDLSVMRTPRGTMAAGRWYPRASTSN